MLGAHSEREWSVNRMFGRWSGREEPAVPRGVDHPDDWAPFENLDEAVRTYCFDPDTALVALASFISSDDVLGFTLEKVVDFDTHGTSVWQEIAVVDDRRLLLWHGEEKPDDEDGTNGGSVLESSVRVIPLGAIVDMGLRTRWGSPTTGARTPLSVSLYLATQTAQGFTSQTDSDGDVQGVLRQEIYRFSKSVEDGGPAQMARLIQFGQVVGKLLGRELG